MILKDIARMRFCFWLWLALLRGPAGDAAIGRVTCLVAWGDACPTSRHSLEASGSGAAEPFLTQKPRLIVHLEAEITDLELGSAFTREKAPLDRTKALLEVLKR